MIAETNSFFTEQNSAEAVNERMSDNMNPRLREIMGALVKHLHTFAKEVSLSHMEWETAISFLTTTGQICTQERQEFILLSDTLGLSMLVDAISNKRPEEATESTVLGPFHVEGAPRLPMGANISLDGKGDRCIFEGVVRDVKGNPICNAKLDVWSDNSDGYYDVQQPDVQPKWNNRGVFYTGADGKYCFIGIKPVSYPIPADGPVGKMLAALGRHPYRPAHMHFIVTAPGFQKLVTHTFVSEDEYLNSDAVFGVKRSLVASYERQNSGFSRWRSVFDFVLTEKQFPDDLAHRIS